jgi:hypothetical protein
MELKTHINPILERAEELSKNGFTIIKFKLLAKTADISSSAISRLLLLIILCFFVLTLNIGIALWLGELLGKNYFGFLTVALFYGFIGTIFLFLHPYIKTRISDFIIKKSLANSYE